MYKAKREDRNIVVEILVSAFENHTSGSSINLVVRNDKRRPYRLKVFMRYLFDRAMRFGDVYISDNNKACILIKFSDREKVTMGSIWEDLKFVYRCIGIKRLIPILRRQKIMSNMYPKEPHIRPVIYGVLEKDKGNGTAARLLLELFKANSDNKLPIVIDTVSDSNVKLYKKFGFRIVHQDDSLGFPLRVLRMN